MAKRRIKPITPHNPKFTGYHGRHLVPVHVQLATGERRWLLMLDSRKRRGTFRPGPATTAGYRHRHPNWEAILDRRKATRRVEIVRQAPRTVLSAIKAIFRRQA